MSYDDVCSHVFAGIRTIDNPCRPCCRRADARNPSTLSVSPERMHLQALPCVLTVVSIAGMIQEHFKPEIRFRVEGERSSHTRRITRPRRRRTRIWQSDFRPRPPDQRMPFLRTTSQFRRALVNQHAACISSPPTRRNFVEQSAVAQSTEQSSRSTDFQQESEIVAESWTPRHGIVKRPVAGIRLEASAYQRYALAV